MSEQVTNQPAPPPRDPTCPECGAVVRDRLATRCEKCDEPINVAGIGGAPNRFRLAEPCGDNPAWAVVGVSSLLLFVALAALVPGILIGLVVLSIPVLVRVVVVSRRSMAAGQTITPESVTRVFLTSVGIAAVVVIASVAAFFVTCFAVFPSGSSGSPDRLRLGIAIGGVVALVGFVLMIRALSRRKE